MLIGNGCDCGGEGEDDSKTCIGPIETHSGDICFPIDANDECTIQSRQCPRYMVPDDDGKYWSILFYSD